MEHLFATNIRKCRGRNVIPAEALVFGKDITMDGGTRITAIIVGGVGIYAHTGTS